MNKKYLSVPEAAKILGISRIAVFQKIKKGELPAEKIGSSYAIQYSDLELLLKYTVSGKQKINIDFAVHKTVKEYGEALKMLKDT